MRSAIAAMLAIVLGGVFVLVLIAAGDERERAFRLPAGDGQPVAKLAPGDTACQRPLTSEGDFRSVVFTAGAARRTRLTVRAIPLDAGRRPPALEQAELAPGKSAERVRFDRTVRREERFALCVRNSGRGLAALYGAQARPDDVSALTGDGTRDNADIGLLFLREQPRSVLSDLPEMFERAALFRPGFIGAWTFWLLFLGVVIGVPALLAAALRETGDG